MSRVKNKRALPRGPHDLSRKDVEESQRKRLYLAMIESVAEKGYAQATVADALARSGVSRATFYALFKDKEDCFRGAYEMAAGQIASVLAEGIQGMLASSPETKKTGAGRNSLRQLEWVIGLYLDMLASEPSFAKAYLVEVYAAGPQAIQQRQASLEGFIDVIAYTLRDQTGLFGGGAEQRFAIKVLVHAVSSMVTSMIGAGEADRLPELREPLMKLAAELTGTKRKS